MKEYKNMTTPGADKRGEPVLTLIIRKVVSPVKRESKAI